MPASNYVTIHVDKIIAETEKAFLLEVDEAQHWMPKGQVADAKDFEMGMENFDMSITEFIADKKGIEGVD